jgi:hypothetical protein
VNQTLSEAHACRAAIAEVPSTLVARFPYVDAASISPHALNSWVTESRKIRTVPMADARASGVDGMKEDPMWLDIGPEKRALLKGHGFGIVSMGFVRRGKSRSWTLAFDHVRDTPLATLRAELARLPRN